MDVDTDLDMVLGGSVGLDFTVVPGDRAGYAHQAVPPHRHLSSPTSLHTAQAVLPLFLAHLSTTYLHIVVVPAVSMPRG